MEKIPLGLVESGRTAIIGNITGNEHLRRELFEQGLVDGSQVEVIKNDIGGPLIISVNNMRLAVGRGVALQIWVEIAEREKKFQPELVNTNIS